MAALPYRYQEILTALRDHPKGLTTGQIFKICQNKGGSELPDSTITGQCIYAMRHSKQLTTSEAVGGSIHKITQKGLDKLCEALAESTTPLLSAESEGESGKPPLPAEADDDIGPEQPIEDSPDLLQSFDTAMAVIRSALIQSLETPPVRIQDKHWKIEVLTEIEPLLSPDRAELLAQIRGDLEQLQEATE